MSLEELMACWSGLLLWVGLRPLFQRMIEADLAISEQVVLHGLQHGPLTVSEVAACLHITQSAASRAVDRLVRDGLISRVEDPADRRQKLLSLTPAGEALVGDSEQTLARNVLPLVAPLNPAEREQFRQLLARIIAAQAEDAVADAVPCA
jgi:DNA-binding MarR family transcriptional regulator